MSWNWWPRDPPIWCLLDLTSEITFAVLTEMKHALGNSKIVLWVNNISTELAFQAMGLGVRGILRRTLPTDLQVKCLQKVQAGELWFEKALTDSFLCARRVALTQREGQLVSLLSQGLKNKEIATTLMISEGTVKVYLSRLFQKVGVKDRFELALFGLKNLTTGQLPTGEKGPASRRHARTAFPGAGAPLASARASPLPGASCAPCSNASIRISAAPGARGLSTTAPTQPGWQPAGISGPPALHSAILATGRTNRMRISQFPALAPYGRGLPSRRTSLGTAAMNRRVLWVSLGLAAACLLVFGQVVRFGFINFDDNAYVYENPWVRSGFTFPGVVWAFTVIDYFYWQPLTWLSHMLDCQLFGLRPGWHHLVNLLFHIANSLLVFSIFRRLTGAFWRSAVLAALFALHPLRLESVVWIAERKDVLSAFWFLVTVRAYLWFAEPSFGSAATCACCLAFALGLMSKPMLVTTPRAAVAAGLLAARPPRLERKTSPVPDGGPHLGHYVCGHQPAASINWAGGLPFAHRLANALVSYTAYLELALWPHRLAILYPYRSSIAWWKPLAAAATARGPHLGRALVRQGAAATWRWAGCGS